MAFWALSFLLCLQSKAEAPIVEHTIVDDGYAVVGLDFPFQFYGNTYTTTLMFANGVVGLLAPENYQWGLCCNGEDLDQFTNYGSRLDFTLMPFHTDLISINGVGKFYTQGDENSMKYMWKNLQEYYRPGSLNDFDMTIYPLGNIEMSYRRLDIQNHSVTVGVVNDLSEGEYIQWFYHSRQDGVIYWDSATDTPIEVEDQSICEAVPDSHLSCAWYPLDYAENFLAAECGKDVLYSEACPGYAENFLAAECAKDNLYSQACPNWETAWLNQQCLENPQSSPYCPNYVELVEEPVVVEESVFEVIPETYVEIDLIPALADYDIDLTIEIETDMDSFEEVEMTVEEIEAEIESEIEALIEEPVEEEVIEEPIEEVVEETTESVPEEIESNEPEEMESEIMLAETEPEKPTKSKEQIKNDKLNKIIAVKLAKVHEQRAVATTLEEQANLEALIIALMNFNAGYKNYSGILPDGVGYESKDIYMDSFIPDNKRGLRVGLAQELQHKKMVDLQWQR